jgi:aryl-alcohol dehydrogenase-like predicted oxidoreductase
MEYRQLGRSGLMVPALTLGTGTFGGGNEFFKAWGATDVKEASQLVDICLDAGLSIPAAWRKKFLGRRSRGGGKRC